MEINFSAFVLGTVALDKNVKDSLIYNNQDTFF